MPNFPRDNHPTEGSRQDQFAIKLLVNYAGTNYDTGYWDKKTGGELDSEEIKYWPGASGVSVSLGGRINPGNITLQRLYDRTDDHTDGRIGVLLAGVGKASCTVWQRPYNADGVMQGKTFYWKGTLKRVLVPDVDSEATSAALLEVEISVAGGSPDFKT